VSLSSGDGSPHIFTQKSRLRPGKFFINGEKRVLQHSGVKQTLCERPDNCRAAQRRLPAIYEASEFVESGGLISYGPNLPVIERRAAEYVDKIFKGAKPADLPVEQPTKFEMVINMKTANALNLSIPQPL
jgi:hypothetical protein